jgi:hypothetical protein
MKGTLAQRVKRLEDALEPYAFESRFTAIHIIRSTLRSWYLLASGPLELRARAWALKKAVFTTEYLMRSVTNHWSDPHL